MRKYTGAQGRDLGLPRPGAVTAAPAFEEAVEMAAEALLLHVEGMLAEGEAIPEPSTREQVLANAEYRGGKPVWVPLKTDAWIGRVIPPRS